ncbi:MAG: alanine--tRNA ligase, partial [Aliifodinibius sp.]|nr:alanine--tRNA ligase [Fodinibius sp.]NIV15680.1 alanine--tRNA ligase [Fodinibius sp.]NIV98580.1 alanine--tRNA ligase [Candidatus Saccharibacteria bacterium]NIY30512.1 alanine--tRNA ligase [Fodinibius sp.]
MISANELRQKYLDFFKEKGHVVISSASLIPENDPTALFISAGMHPLVPNLLGEKHPAGKRLVNFQKCVRTGDIEEVGDKYHHTFFEMLGNWSLGDYFKKEAIKMSYEFLTGEKWLGLDPNKIAVSVFEGDDDAPYDEESYKGWSALGIPDERIKALSKTDNWWGPAAKTGPCGPDTEIFYWVGEGDAPVEFDPQDTNWIEIWNDVFMEYNKTSKGNYAPLKQKNVDTGMGLERTLACLNGLDDDYRTELFWPIMHEIETLSDKKYGDDEDCDVIMRIIADHVRSAVFILGDDLGMPPSNLDQGYILRRLIRRAVRYARRLGINMKSDATVIIAKKVIDLMSGTYPELLRNQERVITELKKEEDRFERTLERGLKEFNKSCKDKIISGEEAFNLFSTYGFPLEMTIELADEQGIRVDVDSFEKEFEKHQEVSRAGAEQKFAGGLADESEDVTKLHTATHLLHAALRNILGDHVEQRGSNITAERLRFDFVHPKKMTDEEIQKVEDWVNDIIKKDIKVECEEMTVEKAKEIGAIGIFTQKYEEMVKVYTITDPKTGEKVSMEICGGPHIARTSELGLFKIKKEQA